MLEKHVPLLSIEPNESTKKMPDRILVRSNAQLLYTEIKNLKHENKVLKKELNRKEKALAETAALLVLQKKVHEIWGSDEDSSL